MPENRETEMIQDIARMVKANNETLEAAIANMERVRAEFGESVPKRPHLTLVEEGEDAQR